MGGQSTTHVDRFGKTGQGQRPTYFQCYENIQTNSCGSSTTVICCIRQYPTIPSFDAWGNPHFVFTFSSNWTHSMCAAHILGGSFGSLACADTCKGRRSNPSHQCNLSILLSVQTKITTCHWNRLSGCQEHCLFPPFVERHFSDDVHTFSAVPWNDSVVRDAACPFPLIVIQVPTWREPFKPWWWLMRNNQTQRTRLPPIALDPCCSVHFKNKSLEVIISKTSALPSPAQQSDDRDVAICFVG